MAALMTRRGAVVVLLAAAWFSSCAGAIVAAAAGAQEVTREALVRTSSAMSARIIEVREEKRLAHARVRDLEQRREVLLVAVERRRIERLDAELARLNADIRTVYAALRAMPPP